MIFAPVLSKKSSILPLLTFSAGVIIPLVFATSLAAQPPTFRAIALSGDPAPGTASGVTFGALGLAGINASGRVMFVSRLQGPGVTNNTNHGIWTQAPGNYSLVAREGASAPGLTGWTFSEFIQSPPQNLHQSSDPQLTDSGAINFSNVPLAADFAGIWSTSPFFSLAAAEGDFVPAEGGIRMREFRNISHDANGRVTMVARLTSDPGITTANDFAILNRPVAPNGFSIVAREGNQAPGTPAGSIFTDMSSLSLPPVLVGELGSVAFSSKISGPGVTPNVNDRGLWSNRGGFLSPVFRTGQMLPSLNLQLLNFSQMSVDRQGYFSLTAGLTDGVSPSHDYVLAEYANGIRIVTDVGRPAPGYGTGVNFSGFGLNPLSRAADGETAFVGSVLGPGITQANDSGIWTEYDGTLQLAAREGMIAPGAGGATFSDNFTDTGFLFNINPSGQVAFLGNTNDSSFGLWAQDSDGVLQKIIRTGELFEVAPGDFRTVIDIDTVLGTTGVDGRRCIFNEHNELVFNAAFADGTSGVFVAAVPEPGVLLPLLPLIALFRRRPISRYPA